MASNATALITPASVIGATVSINGVLAPLDDPRTGMLTTPTAHPHVYEVVRVIDGVVLFLDDHLARLGRSITSAGVSNSTQIETIKRWVCEFVAAQQLRIGNLFIAVDDTTTVIHQRTHTYPAAEVYRMGVVTGTLALERADPNAKVLRAEYQRRVAAALAAPQMGEQVFEVLLVDRDGYVTEGSRTNVFFVRGAEVWTAPAATVLEGITRKYVIAAARSVGLRVVEEKVRLAEIGMWDVFLSGTSIGVLAVRRVGAVELGSAASATVMAVRRAYEGLVREHVG